MTALGYKNYYKVLNAKNYGIPQNRERVFTISIRNDIENDFVFPEEKELKLKLKDMLEETVDEKYYLSNEHLERITKWKSYQNPSTNYREIIKIKNATKKGYLEATSGDGIDISSRMQYHRGNVQKETIQTIDCTGGEGHGVVTNDSRIRKLTPKECWRLMGFDDEDFEKASKVNSNTQLYKQAGNSIVVNVLEKILTKLLKESEIDEVI